MEDVVRPNERKIEWDGLKFMICNYRPDGKVLNSEASNCMVQLGKNEWMAIPLTDRDMASQGPK